MLDVSVPDRAPYPVDDPVPPTWEQAQQRNCPLVGGYPVNGAVSRVGAHPIIGIWKEPNRGKLPGVHPLICLRGSTHNLGAYRNLTTTRRKFKIMLSIMALCTLIVS